MPCVGCEKECKCTAEKCAEGCKCSSPGKCGCNQSIAEKSSTSDCCKKTGSCCKKTDESGDCKVQKDCCKDNN